MLTVGERIKKAREEKNISQTELATSINISKQNLYKYENNIITNIPSDKIESIAKYLKISPCYIMGWDNNAEIKTNQMLLSNHEKAVITAYRNRTEMQPAVDKLLGVNDDVYVLRAARSKTNEPIEYIKVSKEKMEEIRNAKSVEDEVDL